MGLNIAPNASSPTGGSASFSWTVKPSGPPQVLGLPDPTKAKNGAQQTVVGRAHSLPGGPPDITYTNIDGQWVKGFWGKDANGQWVGTGQNAGDPWSAGKPYDPATAEVAGSSRAQPGSPGVPLPGSWVSGDPSKAVAPPAPGVPPGPPVIYSGRTFGTGSALPAELQTPGVTAPVVPVSPPPGGWSSTPIPVGQPGAPPLPVVGGGIADPSLAAAIQNSRNLQTQYNRPAVQLAAPQASASLIGPVERAQQQAAIQAQQIQAAQIAAYQAAQEVGPIQAGIATAGQSTAAQIQATALAREQAKIQAERVQAALAAKQGDISAERVGAAQADRTVLGPTELAAGTRLAPTALSDQTTIDALKQAEFREGQEGLVSGLQGAIEGKDPSVAAIMLRQATERNQANQFALAQAASGGNVGFAQRQAMINSADINQQSIGQQALLRAQEIATARGQLGSVLSSGRESDIGLATSQAGMTQQVKLANAGFTNTANMTQAQLDQAIKLANAGFKNTATTTQAQLDQATSALNVTQKNQVALANANNALDAAKTNVALAQQVALANQSAENNARLENAKNALAAATRNAELAQQVALANQSAENNTSQVNAQLANATGIANAGNVTQASVATAGNQTSAANTTASLNAAIRQTNATNQSNTNTNQAKLTQEASTSNASNNLTASKSNAELAQQVALANALAANKAAETNANNQTNVSQSNATNRVNTNGQQITANQNAAQNTLTASGQQITAAAAKAQADATAKALATQQANRREDQIIGGVKAITSGINSGSGSGGTTPGATPATDGGGGATTPAYNTDTPGVSTAGNQVNPDSGIGENDDYSDRRLKKKIRRADAEISALLGSIKPYGFEYRDPKKLGVEGGKRFGLMAQDLEKSKAGKTLVHDAPQGKKVDTNRAVLAALAALGNVDKRLKSIERKAA